MSSSVGFTSGDAITIAGNSNSACNGTLSVVAEGGSVILFDGYLAKNCHDPGGTGGTMTDDTSISTSSPIFSLGHVRELQHRRLKRKRDNQQPA